MNKIWKFLNGKKSTIGIILLVAAGAPWDGIIPAGAIDIIYYFGAALAGAGSVHRYIKYKTPSN